MAPCYRSHRVGHPTALRPAVTSPRRSAASASPSFGGDRDDGPAIMAGAFGSRYPTSRHRESAASMLSSSRRSTAWRSGPDATTCGWPSGPRSTVRIPPASRTRRAPAAQSHGPGSTSKKPSSRPDDQRSLPPPDSGVGAEPGPDQGRVEPFDAVHPDPFAVHERTGTAHGGGRLSRADIERARDQLVAFAVPTRDGHGPPPAPVDEVRRAVQGVDDPGESGRTLRGRTLLALNAIAGAGCGQDIQDRPLGGPVGVGDEVVGA